MLSKFFAKNFFFFNFVYFTSLIGPRFKKSSLFLYLIFSSRSKYFNLNLLLVIFLHAYFI